MMSHDEVGGVRGTAGGFWMAVMCVGILVTSLAATVCLSMIAFYQPDPEKIYPVLATFARRRRPDADGGGLARSAGRHPAPRRRVGAARNGHRAARRVACAAIASHGLVAAVLIVAFIAVAVEAGAATR